MKKPSLPVWSTPTTVFMSISRSVPPKCYHRYCRRHRLLNVDDRRQFAGVVCHRRCVLRVAIGQGTVAAEAAIRVVGERDALGLHV